MSPVQERKFLRAVLKRLDNAEHSTRTARRKLVLAWLGLVVTSAVATALGRILPLPATELLFVAIGAIGAGVYVYIVAGRGWGILKPYVRRDEVEARLSELGA
jgi:hypothetical protein